MKKLFSYVFEPKVPARSAEEAAQHTRPLVTCRTCSYVLCSCGNCHSEHCHQTCLHTDEIAEDYNTEVQVSEDFQRLLDNQLGKW